MTDFEKLGVLYLGRPFDLGAKKAKDGLLLYDSKDLVTHAVCFGMTGSGKTGLCLSVLEEAAIDGIPSLVIDPKGDLCNLLLTFPDLRPEDFAPWINLDDARSKGVSPEEYARRQAELWKNGLASWGQDGARIRRLRDAADFAIYTPGSNAGLPVSILSSFAAPPPEVVADGESFRERVGVTATAILGLLGMEADPIQSREHILLSTILSSAWKQGLHLDLAALIQQVQAPPFQRVGVLDLEAFYPSKDRFGLSMALNNLLASPGFEAWLEGEPLDIQSMLYTAQGKPRVSIFSIAHLSDAERMFFVSLLLNQTLAWMRAQSGTTSLRALLYMDEIFGYFPPVANPPSKQPLLTLLKQARAFGLGVVLATQNPVDLDYKGLANAGTWFIGRLQTERDQQRVLDGLEGAVLNAGSGFDREMMRGALSRLGNRVFLMNNVHEDTPEVFETRWVMSYLRGPLTRAQIKTLMDPRKLAIPSPATAATTVTAPSVVPAVTAEARPVLPPDVPQYFVPVRGVRPPDNRLVYQPMLLGSAQVRFVDPKAKIDVLRDFVYLTPVREGAVPVDWQESVEAQVDVADLEKEHAPGAAFAPLPAIAGKAKNYASWGKDFTTWLYGSQSLEIFRSSGLKQVSVPGETERDFRARLGQAAREERDRAVAELRQKYHSKISAIEERIRRAEQAVAREQEQAQAHKMQTAISIGATLLGAFLGRKAVSTSTMGRAATAARTASRTWKESQDVGRATETVEALRQQLQDLEEQFNAETQQLEAAINPMTEALETVSVKPKKTNISVRLVALAWTPNWQGPSGELTQAF